MPAKNDDLTSQTIGDFGEQWTRYTDNPGYYGSTELLADIVEPLLPIGAIAGARVAEIGSGTGRIVNMMLDAGAAHVVALEPSDAMQVLRENTAGAPTGSAMCMAVARRCRQRRTAISWSRSVCCTISPILRPWCKRPSPRSSRGVSCLSGSMPTKAARPICGSPGRCAP